MLHSEDLVRRCQLAGRVRPDAVRQPGQDADRARSRLGAEAVRVAAAAEGLITTDVSEIREICTVPFLVGCTSRLFKKKYLIS